MTEKADGKVRVDRRMFLRGASVAAVAAPATAIAAEKLVKPTEHRLPARYQETDHVKRFYALNRR